MLITATDKFCFPTRKILTLKNLLTARMIMYKGGVLKKLKTRKNAYRELIIHCCNGLVRCQIWNHWKSSENHGKSSLRHYFRTNSEAPEHKYVQRR